jgi:hypothetical protein
VARSESLVTLAFFGDTVSHLLPGCWFSYALVSDVEGLYLNRSCLCGGSVAVERLVDGSVVQMEGGLLSVYRTLCAASTCDAEELRREHEDEIEMVRRESMLEIQRR